MAQEVAYYLKMPTLAGSDAHWPMEIGRRFANLLERDVTSDEEFLEEMRAGRISPAQRVDGVFVPLEEPAKPRSSVGDERYQ